MQRDQSINSMQQFDWDIRIYISCQIGYTYACSYVILTIACTYVCLSNESSRFFDWLCVLRTGSWFPHVSPKSDCLQTSDMHFCLLVIQKSYICLAMYLSPHKKWFIYKQVIYF